MSWVTDPLSLVTIRPPSSSAQSLPLSATAAGPSWWGVEFIYYPPFLGVLEVGVYPISVSGSVTVTNNSGKDVSVGLRELGAYETIGVAPTGGTTEITFDDVALQGSYGEPITDEWAVAVELTISNVDESDGVDVTLVSANFTYTLSNTNPVPDPDPDPGPGACFWTDLVNATQVCGSDPGPSDGTMSFGVGWPSLLNYGRDTEMHESMCDAQLYSALVPQPTDVFCTGYALSGWDGIEGPTCGSELPAGLEWVEDSTQLVPGNIGSIYYYRYDYASHDDTFIQGLGYWVRISVNGLVYYGHYRWVAV